MIKSKLGMKPIEQYLVWINWAPHLQAHNLNAIYDNGYTNTNITSRLQVNSKLRYQSRIFLEV